MTSQRALRAIIITAIATLSAASAFAQSWDDYELGEFYPVEDVDEPVIARSASAVVYFGGATGFIISPEGHVLTNHHVYDGFGDAGVIHRQCHASGCEERLEVELVVANPAYDMALYRVTGEHDPFDAIPIRTEVVEPGEAVVIIGHPSSKPQRVSFGTILARDVRFAGLTSVEYSAQTWWGSSGSPVIDREGRAVAIHWGWDSEGVSNGRLTGIPFALMAPAIPEIAAIADAHAGGLVAVDEGDDALPVACLDPDTYAIRTRLVRSDAQTNSAGTALDSIVVSLDADEPACLSLVQGVTYHLHKTFRNPTLPGDGAEAGFPIQLAAWGYFQSRARITLASSETLDVRGMIRW